MLRHRCECCGNYTLSEEGAGTDEICPVCYWQNGYVQLNDSDFKGGANEVSLNQARENYKAFGAKEKRVINYVRKPLSEELPENNS